MADELAPGAGVQRHRTATAAGETVELTTVVLQKTNSSDIKLLQFRTLHTPPSCSVFIFPQLRPLLIGNSFPKHPFGSREVGAQVKKSNYQKSFRLPAPPLAAPSLSDLHF